MTGVLHPDEVPVDEKLVAQLLAAQFPQWSGLAVERFDSTGTDNLLFRLGDEVVARFPRRPSSVPRVVQEATWLPRLGPHLPVAVPPVLGVGAPGSGYPFPWSVCGWMPGRPATPDALVDPVETAGELAALVRALHAIDPTGAPPPGPANVGRGGPLSWRDEAVDRALRALADDPLVDVAACAAVWRDARAAREWPGPPVWVHGDLGVANLLVDRGRLAAVIDWGCLAAGDPACELLPAWGLFRGAARSRFRSDLGLDEDTWARGRGWAVSMALIGIPYYRESNPRFVTMARALLAAALG